ncbi:MULTISPECIES: glucoamylase family protein [unclassified Cellulophaga]|uniref:glucoamylase family protein n=1 Tax=unclassified Cellulophaga TaxID=2634405 RepID=UPI0026E11834|nr:MULTISPECIES: glucoamylase family protein [unclassified Cellulophaga]MDO6491319.1 glucoamylase family protein [Cellulophaga sp. 2_MG-2023]MDO6495148.1 glucoamylase family protein [Cellulophaga sp. 3_MG-2023]
MRLILVVLAVASLLTGCNNKPKKVQKQVWTDEALMDTVQKQTFSYFWDGAEPVSGLARERIHLDSIYPTHDKDIITIGGSGFGLMAIVVGAERGYITKEEALSRFEKSVDFLEKADRFHGAWPHWLLPSGKVAPFSAYDDGGDLVETAFLIQGLLTVKEYYANGGEREQKLVAKIQKLWEEVEWDWYTKGENTLYWHWSPNVAWKMNFPVGGYNEALIMYILAAASPTHPVSKEVYDEGWALKGEIAKDTVYYGLETELNHYEHDASPVGPLFWAHYSYLGLNPKGLTDAYADYWKLNVNHAKIHYRHAVENPNKYKGYGKNLWGLTSSYSVKGYAGHRPDNDLGIISPTAALSSIAYTPEESLQFLRYMYTEQDSLIGKYGPYDAFSLESDWSLPRYLAIDQGPIPVMIENYRTGLLWDLFMKNKDLHKGLEKLGFSTKHKNDN